MLHLRETKKGLSIDILERHLPFIPRFLTYESQFGLYETMYNIVNVLLLAHP
jgi:hypothetical protein